MMILLHTNMYAKELTQKERNRIAVALIPIINMLLMDDTPVMTPEQMLILEKIKAYAENNSSDAPLLKDYLGLNLKGVSSKNLSKLNSVIARLHKNDVDTISKIQKQIDIINDDKIKPVITIRGKNPTTIYRGTHYKDAGATAMDNVDGYVRVKVVKNSVNSRKEGQYEVKYMAMDRAKNRSYATRKVIVKIKPTQDDNDTTTYSGKLNVRGWPNYFAMGTVTDNAFSINNKIAEGKVDAIFKYAGNGFGNRGAVIEPTVTAKTIKQARAIELLTHKKVMPVMVVYTANSSGGGMAPEDVKNYKNLVAHYRSLIKMLKLMQSKKDKNHPVPATIVLNPDLFGEWQKGKSSKNFQKEYGDSGNFKHIDVKKALKEALRSENIEKSAILSAVDSDISNDVLGWVKSQSLLIKHIAPDVVFGWVINLWNPGTSLWSHADTQATLKAANSVVSFLKFIKAYHAGGYKPDFITFDKYERDGFSAAGKPYYAFGSREWKNYLTFVKKITDNINSPAMLWQIPGGHMPIEGEEGLCETDVTSNCFNYMQHSASGGTYFMGDDRIGSSVENIMQEVLNIPLSPSIYGGASTVKALLMQDPNYDWSQSQIELAKSANVFAILWGGGETTGVSPISTNQTGGFKWLAQKVSSYEQHPQKLDGKSDWNIHVDLPPKNTR